MRKGVLPAPGPTLPEGKQQLGPAYLLIVAADIH